MKMTTLDYIKDYKVRLEMVNGYLKNHNYNSPICNRDKDVDFNEVNEIEFKLHVLEMLNILSVMVALRDLS